MTESVSRFSTAPSHTYVNWPATAPRSSSPGPGGYGTSGWAESGSTLPESTVDACRDADVVLSGAVGTHPGISSEQCPNPEAALIKLRHIFDLRISVRTVRVPGDTDVIIVRNITGGAYAGPDQRLESDGTCDAEDRIVLNPRRGQEVFDIGVKHARAHPDRRIISVDKASVYATSRLWRRTSVSTSAATGLRIDNVNVDRAAYELVKYEKLPAVVITEGLFGDILSDIVCARAGSPALCGSATINPDRHFGNGITALFEPAHGLLTAPHRKPPLKSPPALGLRWSIYSPGARPRRARPTHPAARSAGTSSRHRSPNLRPRQPRHASPQPRPIQRTRARRARGDHRMNHPASTTFAASAPVQRVASASLRAPQPTATPTERRLNYLGGIAN